MNLSSRKRASASVPVMAMVDAFVCMVGIILILVVLSAFDNEKSGQFATPEVVLTCTEDGNAIHYPGVGDFDFTDMALPKFLTSNAKANKLSLNVLIRVTVDHVTCGQIIANLFRKANRLTDIRQLGHPSPVFLFDIEYIEAADEG